jgi:hypothetical protein
MLLVSKKPTMLSLVSVARDGAFQNRAEIDAKSLSNMSHQQGEGLWLWQSATPLRISRPRE